MENEETGPRFVMIPSQCLRSEEGNSEFGTACGAFPLSDLDQAEGCRLLFLASMRAELVLTYGEDVDQGDHSDWTEGYHFAVWDLDAGQFVSCYLDKGVWSDPQVFLDDPEVPDPAIAAAKTLFLSRHEMGILRPVSASRIVEQIIAIAEEILREPLKWPEEMRGAATDAVYGHNYAALVGAAEEILTGSCP
jgi:hypothetical protein